jgi:hypothetical protein
MTTDALNLICASDMMGPERERKIKKDKEK